MSRLYQMRDEFTKSPTGGKKTVSACSHLTRAELNLTGQSGIFDCDVTIIETHGRGTEVGRILNL